MRLESWVESFVTRRRPTVKTRVRFVSEGREPLVIDLGTGSGADALGSDRGYDVELIGSELVLRALLARPRDAIALFLLGRVRVRGHIDHVETLSRLARGEGV